MFTINLSIINFVAWFRTLNVITLIFSQKLFETFFVCPSFKIVLMTRFELYSLLIVQQLRMWWFSFSQIPKLFKPCWTQFVSIFMITYKIVFVGKILLTKFKYYDAIFASNCLDDSMDNVKISKIEDCWSSSVVDGFAKEFSWFYF